MLQPGRVQLRPAGATTRCSRTSASSPAARPTSTTVTRSTTSSRRSAATRHHVRGRSRPASRCRPARNRTSEEKIDLPDTWVRGFLQVSSAMALPAHVVRPPPDGRAQHSPRLAAEKGTGGPRSLRYMLTPGAPVQVVFEPWNEVVCRRSSTRRGPAEIRIWGRRRLAILERLIPMARSVPVHCPAGPAVVLRRRSGRHAFTLGLSGWTANDWSTAGNFDLLAPRHEVDDFTNQRVFAALGDMARPPTGSQRPGCRARVPPRSGPTPRPAASCSTSTSAVPRARTRAGSAVARPVALR